MSEMEITIGQMRWKNPVTVASGTFGLEYQELINLSQLGAIVTKTITPEPKLGNEPPRIAETEAGLLNSIGLENPGVKGFIEEELPGYRLIDTNLIVSLSASTVNEFKVLVTELDRFEGIDGYEINISCPNVEKEGIAFGTDKNVVFNLVRTLRNSTQRTLIIKLSPNVTSIGEIALAAEDGGADALALINTVYGMAIDVKTKKSKMKSGIAGYSGIGIKPIALQCVYRVAQIVHIPIIGMGGIRNTNDALEFILAGATAVAVGTYNFVNPLTTIKIINELEMYLHKNSISYADLIGSLQI
ncbi:MAG: dihydroorotate dehydrogenase [Candidatus Cloacimonadia bacterium]